MGGIRPFGHTYIYTTSTYAYLPHDLLGHVVVPPLQRVLDAPVLSIVYTKGVCGESA